MIFPLFKSEKEKEELSELKNPFEKECISSVWFSISRKWDKTGWDMYAKIGFQNGETKGEQKLEAADFGTLVKRVQSFLEQLI